MYLLLRSLDKWIYRNTQIHDNVVETQAIFRKEATQRGIDEQMDLGEAGLLEEDHWMMEVNLGDMEINTREQEEYWLVVIKAARVVA